MNRISPFVKIPPDRQKEDSLVAENDVEGTVLQIASRLKKYSCEKFVFGDRWVFGRTEFEDGEYLDKNQVFYSWPQRKVHKLARDPHPDLEERFPVPDEKVSWTFCPDEKFANYKPEFASETDKNEALKIILEKRKTATQKSRFKSTVEQLTSSPLSECHDLALELMYSSCRSGDNARNPCGRTGLKGKGVLHDWGTNMSCDPVITRVNPYVSGNTQVLVCIPTGSSAVWSLPGGIVPSPAAQDIKLPPQRQIPELLATLFLYNVPKRDKNDEGGGDFPADAAEPLVYLDVVARQGLRQSDGAAAFDRITRAFQSYVNDAARLVYRGYCDDPRNTDDSWIETTVHHCHLPDRVAGLLSISSDVSHWKPPGADLGLDFQWMDVGYATLTNLIESHFEFVELCVPSCKCGRRRYDRSDQSHRIKEDVTKCQSEEATARTRLLWAPKEIQGRTDAGNIQFIGKSTSSHFVRARMETDGDVSHVQLMLHAWGMKQPKAIISLTGGAQDFDMDTAHVDNIFQGVLRAASVTKACIVDGGTDAGVMKLMGLAVARDGHRVDLIGVANWGIVISRECMLAQEEEISLRNEGKKRKPSLQASYRRKTSVMLQLENLIDDYRSHTKRNFYLKTQPNSASGAGLDPNHRYFVLVDDGTVGKFGSEIEARGKLEQALRNPGKFQFVLKMWELSQKIKKLESSSIEDLGEMLELPSDEMIEFRDHLNTYHGNNLNVLCAIHALEKELESRLEKTSIPRFERELIESSIKCWRHLQSILAGQRLDEIIEVLSNHRQWSSDDLRRYYKHLLTCRKQYESNQNFQHILQYFETIQDHVRSEPSSKARRYSPCSDVLGVWGEQDTEIQAAKTESASQHDADSVSKSCESRSIMIHNSRTLLKSHSCIHDDILNLEERTPGNMSPTMKRFAKVRVPHCSRCEGGHRDRITCTKWRNSIPQKEYDQWVGVQSSIKHRTSILDMIVRCKACSCKLTSREIEDEAFFPCSGCDHYFFKSRLLRLRNKGRPHIKCDGCGKRRNLDELLGRFVPAVMIVVQGGPGTISTVVSSNRSRVLDHKRSSVEFDTLEQCMTSCTPVVVVEGSGKAADFIAFTWRHIHEGSRMCYGCPRSSCVGFVRRYHPKSQELLPASCPLIQHEYERIFWGYCQESQHTREWSQGDDESTRESDRKRRLDSKKHVSWVIELCRRKETVTIYNVKSTISLDYSIMRAMCKGTLRDGMRLSTVEQLQLAIEWDLVENNLNAVKLAQREILSDDGWDVGENASDLRESLTSAMVYALRRNSWRFVELLDHAGAMLPNREVLLKSLYPREIDQFSNETVIPNRLRLIMNFPEVKRNAKQRLFTKYRLGILSDEDIGPPEFDNTYIEKTYAWQNVTENILDLQDPIGQYFHVHHETFLDGNPALKIAKTYEELQTIRRNDVNSFRETAVLVVSFEEFEHLLEKRFESEIFGTKAHVEAVMHYMGWTRCNKVLGSTSDQWQEGSNEKAYSELFVWSMMMGRTQLAMFFWRRCQTMSYAHCISRALFASAVARRIASIAGGHASKLLVGDKSDGENKSSVNFASHFETLAKRLMRKGFEMDQQSAVDAILLPWTDTFDCWQDNRGRTEEFLSPLVLAGYAKAESFVDDPAFQSCLDFVWYGGLVLDDEQCQSKFTDEEYILLPFSASHIGELGWRQILFIAVATGAAAIPINIFLSLFVTWETFMIATLLSYLLLPVSMLFLSGFYLRGKDTTILSNTPLIYRILKPHTAENSISFVHQLWRTCSIFYTAPIVKFSGRSVHYILFVLLYTYVGVTMIQDEYGRREMVMHAWFLMLLLSEIRQWAESGWERYVESIWNALDLVIYILYCIAALARTAELLDVEIVDSRGYTIHLRDLGGYNETNDSHGALGHAVAARYEYQFQDLMQARGLHGLVGIFLWVRLLDILRVDQHLGPLVLVLTSMVNDVLRFALVLFCFVIGFGVSFICSARPYADGSWRCNGGKYLGTTFNDYDECAQLCTAQCHNLFWRQISSSISYSYFEILGEHWLDWEYFASNPVDPMEPDANRVLGPTLLAIYLMISGIVLLNLLIAMKWRYQKMELVLEIVSEPWAPPPFNLFVDAWIIFGRPQLPAWLQRRPEIAGSQEQLTSRERRWERARGAMERVRQVILKEMDVVSAYNTA